MNVCSRCNANTRRPLTSAGYVECAYCRPMLLQEFKTIVASLPDDASSFEVVMAAAQVDGPSVVDVTVDYERKEIVVRSYI